MGEVPREDITFWLEQWHSGKEGALDQLTELVYCDLRRLAAYCMQEERSDHTLQATALVHEVYLRLPALQGVEWKNRAQYISVASNLMRRILVDHARRRLAAKRNPGQLEPEPPPNEPSFNVLGVDLALAKMTTTYPRHAQIVEMRFFGGLDSPEIAETLGVGVRTVERDWAFAKAWLNRELGYR